MESQLSTYLAVLFLALLSGMTTLIGVGLAVWLGKNEKGIALGIGFSAGIMLLISMFELLPEAIHAEGLQTTVYALLSGVLLLAVLHWVIPHTHLVEETGAFNHALIRSSYLVAFGLILHDFPEGFAMANSFIVSPSLGVLVAVAIALHNIPEEFAMAAPVAAFTKRRFLIGAAIVSALAEPVGAIIGLFAVHIRPAFNPMFMSFAAGAMIYISIHELIPMAKIYRQTKLFLIGSAFSVLVYVLLNLLIPE
jgi:ZIP family zinc transporter